MAGQLRGMLSVLPVLSLRDITVSVLRKWKSNISPLEISTLNHKINDTITNMILF